MSDSGPPFTVDPRRLRAEPLQEQRGVIAFVCGDADLDRFITTEEVLAFEDAGLGRTYLVFYDGALVAYYTLSNDSLRMEYIDSVKSLSPAVERQVDAFPAVKIGRLAVARDWQSRGVGRHLVSLIALEALLQGRRSGVRLLILEAMPQAVSFYRRCGFRLTKETRRERGKRNRTMYLDLRPLNDLTQ